MKPFNNNFYADHGTSLQCGIYDMVMREVFLAILLWLLIWMTC